MSTTEWRSPANAMAVQRSISQRKDRSRSHVAARLGDPTGHDRERADPIADTIVPFFPATGSAQRFLGLQGDSHHPRWTGRIFALAMWMTWKCRSSACRWRGESGIACDPRYFRATSCRCPASREIINFIGPIRLAGAGHVTTKVMAWIMDTSSSIRGMPCPRLLRQTVPCRHSGAARCDWTGVSTYREAPTLASI